MCLVYLRGLASVDEKCTMYMGGILETHTHTHTHAEVSPDRILLLVDYNLGRFQTQRAYQVTDT